MAEKELPPPARWPLVIAILASLLWLVVALFNFVPAISGIKLTPEMTAFGQAAIFPLIVSAPLALLWLIALNLRERAGVRAARTAMLAEHARFAEIRINQGGTALSALEGRMTALATRIEAVAMPVAAHHATLAGAVDQLDLAAGRLTDASSRAADATATLGSATPPAIAQAEALASLLGRSQNDLQRQIAETEALLERLRNRAAEAETQAQAAATRTVTSIAAVTDAARTAEAALAQPLVDLNRDVDAAFARTAAAMDAARDGVHAQTNAMLASVDQARVTLDHIGGEAATQINTRLTTLLGTSGAIREALEDHAARAHEVVDEINRTFSVLDAKLANSAASGSSALDAIAERTATARDAIHRLGEPIAATETALGAVEAQLGKVGDATGTTLGLLGSALPAALPHIEDMAIRLADLHARSDALAQPIAAGHATIAAAQNQLEAAQASLDAAAVRLGEELVGARDALGEIQQLVGDTSLATSTQLVDVFARVRDIAQNTAGTMRETLANVVVEAEDALDKAGSSRAELAFGTPIRAMIAEVEKLQARVAETAQASSERLTQRLLGLSETVAGVEARIDEADTRFEVRGRNTLAKRSSRLVDSMQAAAIDIAGLLSFHVEDNAWDNYLKGDRSVFARRIAEQLDSNGVRAIERHFAHDGEFRTQATLYIDEFERLIGHILPDREGRSLAVALLSSHIGQLYVALGQAAKRFN